jgi:hypothetical protein
MIASRPFRWSFLTTAILLAAVYLATLTSDYYWDGITFALQIEKVAKGERGASLLFHQNHLLYNAIGFVLYKAARVVGPGIRALPLLQVANALAGALAVAIFFRLAERVTLSRYAAAVASLAFAVSAAWWKMATDANAYILSILLILVCASNLLGSKPRWVVAGLTLAGAMLVHELASLFYPAALAAIWSNRAIERRAKFAGLMSALAWGIAISGYYLCAALLRGATSPLEVVNWATSNPSGQSLSPGRISGFLLFMKLNVDAVIGHSFALFRSQTRWPEFTVAGIAGIVALGFVVVALRKIPAGRAFRSLTQCATEMSEPRRRVVPMLIVWVGTYALFLLFWVPLVYYRVFYAPALALGLGFAIGNYHLVVRSRPSGAAALGVVAVAFFNLAFYVGPFMRSDSNERVAAARNAGAVWSAGTVIYFADHKEADTAFEYFNEQTEWRRLTPAARRGLDEEIERTTGEGRSVWLNMGAAESVDSDWLARRARGKEIEVKTANEVARYVQVSPIE